MCLDSLTSNDAIYMHVSKPPKENSPASAFFSELKTSGDQYSSVPVECMYDLSVEIEISIWFF